MKLLQLTLEEWALAIAQSGIKIDDNDIIGSALKVKRWFVNSRTPFPNKELTIECKDVRRRDWDGADLIFQEYNRRTTRY